ncbi:hypothetical protein BDZ45DRAFT_752972 [Acephala macrosclerotiorum]|nr:hypothetical protein BDZ45DRAFT_752972 [Acephala macrosclerotiorum]
MFTLVPDNFSDGQMTILPINAIIIAKTFDYGKHKLVVIGGNSNCGRFATQFAKIVGIGTIIAIAFLSGEKEMKEMGATHDICGGEEEVTDIIDAVIYDYELAMEMVASQSPSSIAVLHVADVTAQLKERGKPLGRGSGISGWKNNLDEEIGKLYWESLRKWVEEGKILIPKFRVIEGLMRFL